MKEKQHKVIGPLCRIWVLTMWAIHESLLARLEQLSAGARAQYQDHSPNERNLSDILLTLVRNCVNETLNDLPD